MKAIFLDVDGVLNNYDMLRRNGFDYIDPELVARVGMVVDKTGADIVLSSTWRIQKGDRRLVEEALGAVGMSLLDSTPELDGPRADEIRAWLDANPGVVRFAILDDDEDAGFGFEGSFFQTDPEVGLTLDIARATVDYLNGSSS